MSGDGKFRFWTDTEIRTRLGEVQTELEAMRGELRVRNDSRLFEAAERMSVVQRRASFRVIPGRAAFDGGTAS